ncbi:ATP-dependent zinc metalloprotease FtsH [Lasiodiplodia hormozganensis]|uniref:ATP-dependent zinc metalloprotease FtsH n=1 Tax=Lasiodiplodia hormozganensis TaxID=869390 RepID=A0AA39WC45_9PEZI|nr:ATP-dependent zinc metalloprotease FtsH [Lasiodiplodia hormozganensis]
MRDATLGEEHKHQRVTQILRPRSAPADGLQGGTHPPVIPPTKQRGWDDEYYYSDERFGARHAPPGGISREPFAHSGGLLDPGAAYAKGIHRSHATKSRNTPSVPIFDDDYLRDMHPRLEMRASQRMPNAVPRGRPLPLDDEWVIEDEEPFRIHERTRKIETRQQRDPGKEFLPKDTEREDRRIREKYERERREDVRKRQEEEEIERLEKRMIQLGKERAARESRLKVEKKANEAEERALRENKAQCHMDMPRTAPQQSIGGYGRPDSKQPRLDVFRSRPLSKEHTIEWAKDTVEPYVQLKWVTIYEVSEDRSTRWYEDQPQWLQKQDRQVYVAGKKPIFNLNAFLRQLQLGKVPFIVFQEFTKLRHPEVLIQDIQNWPPPTSSNASIQIISNHLSKTFGALLDKQKELKGHAYFQKILRDDDDDDDDDSDDDNDDHYESEVDDWRPPNEDNSDARLLSRRLVNIDLLYFHFQDLFEEGLNSRTEGDHSETELLLKFLRSGFKRNHVHAKQLLAQNKISKDTITYLFKPGAVIVSQNTPRIRGLKLAKLLHTSLSGWGLSCQSWAFDGKFYRVREVLPLPGKDLKDGSVNITSLPFYPLEYAQPEIDQKLLQRGKTFWTFRKPVYVAYSGLDMRRDTAYDQARFLIDPVTWKRYRQAELGLKEDTPMIDTIAQRNGMDESLMVQSDLPSAEFPYLVPENITGFNMQDKKWVDLQVDNISEVKWDKRSFDNLAIAEENKKIIKALVLNKIERDKATDVVPGKGNGLVILLHGGPGTGKTLTAESVADLAEKPLYRVTCGDIGTEPRKVEEYLENVFFLGKIWDCVVLLDEADVFLEQRSLSDLARNALVSVFLRTLEYYDGILILTSNRVGTFDEAFKSRIQLALHYDSLNREQRDRIWNTFIKRLEELNEPIETMNIYANIEKLSEKPLNGRQIRNAITTARQLALFEKSKLNFSHLQESIRVSGQFDEYLHELHGPDDRRMQDEGIRLAPKIDRK